MDITEQADVSCGGVVADVATFATSATFPLRRCSRVTSSNQKVV